MAIRNRMQYSRPRCSSTTYAFSNGKPGSHRARAVFPLTPPKRKRTVAERRFAEDAKRLSELGLREKFERIYETNLWSDPESRSGVGSSLDSTRVVRAELPKVLRRLQTRTLLDVPCGDFTWMEHVDLSG